MTLHLNVPIAVVQPIIDVNNPFYTFSQLGAGQSYFLFDTNPGTTYGIDNPTQACCFPNGSCADLLPGDCAAQGGTAQGPGTSCAITICAGEPVGACCLPAGECVVTDFSDCTERNGTFMGDGTDCLACDNIPVESTSWGKIKGLYR
jgi:hypothetical protein